MNREPEEDHPRESCYRVSAPEAGLRLDRFLKDRIPGASRKEILAWIEAGRVRCRGKAAHKGIRLREGDQVEAELPAVDDREPVFPEPGLPLRVLREDAWLVAVDKPPGLPAHPLRTGERGTLANRLVAAYPEMQGVGYSKREAALLHRLDRDTSGVLLAARTPSAFEQLRDQFEQQRVIKIYTAVVLGRPETRGNISLPIGSRGRQARKVVVFQEPMPRRQLRKLSPAETAYSVVRSSGSHSFVRLRMSTGARHQLRAHMAHLGHPVAGDPLYGPGKNAGKRPEKVPPRQLLHASEIRFFHPEDGREVKIRCPLPEDFRAFLKEYGMEK